MSKIEQVDLGVENDQEKNSSDIKKILADGIFHWPLFVIGIIFCCVIAYLYLRYAQPVYLVNTTLLIKDQKKGGSPSGSDLFNELDLFGSSKVVDNEIEILKSKTLMRKVVDRLNLSATMEVRGRLKSSELYPNKRVQFKSIKVDSTLYGKSLELTFPTSKTYQIVEPITNKVVRGILNKIEVNSFGVYSVNIDGNLFKASSPIILTVDDPMSVTDRYLSALTVSLSSKQSTVLKLSLKTTVPEKGQDILNTLVQVYNEAAWTDKNKTTEATIKFIDERLKLITGELTEVEKDVETFKSTRGLIDVSNDAAIFLENVQANDAKLNEVNLQISVIKDIDRYVNSNTVAEKLPSTLGINDPVLLGQINQLSDLQLQRDRLLATTTENNPVLVPIIKQIETTRASIKSSISNIYKSLLVSRSDLEGFNSEFQKSIKKVPQQERQLISIKRQQTIKESLYLYLLQKKEEAAITYASSVSDSRTVDPAFYSRVPVSPNRQITYLTGLLLGLLFPTLYLYAKNLLNDKVEGKTNLLELTDAPLLGEVILAEGSEAIVVHESSRNAISEQFRAIRTNMQFLHRSGDNDLGRVTLFTSGMSGEGKTFVATNIAAALAISGKRTVLLELDLRKPKVSKYLNLENKVGLSNYLVGGASIDDIIKETKVSPNLYIVGSGPVPPNPSELLVQSDIDTLVSHLKKNFDEILIDSPPIGLVTDAQILSRLADTTIYLVRERVTLKSQAEDLDRLYRSQKFPKLNVILNGVNLDARSSYGYGYGYYSGDEQTDRGLRSFFRNIKKRF